MQARKDAKAGNINLKRPARKGAKSGKIRRISGQAKEQRQASRMQHFGQNKKDFGMFSQNPPVTCFVIRIWK